MTPLIFSLIAGCGVYFLYTAVVCKQSSLRSDAINKKIETSRRHIDDWLLQAGIAKDRRKQVSIQVLMTAVGSGLFGWMLFGGLIAPLVLALFGGSFPINNYKNKRLRRRSEAADAWPRMIEEIRLLCGSLGRPIPQALIEVGLQGPNDMRPAFMAAEREWLISTDFTRTTKVLKDNLADPTADVICETLLLAHNIGGNDIDTRLAALAADRHTDLHARKDARAKQSGVKFARRFVLIVPLGMAFAGISIGNGRAAYATTGGQLGVAIGLATLAACWYWASHLIKLPESKRVLRA